MNSSSISENSIRLIHEEFFDEYAGFVLVGSRQVLFPVIRFSIGATYVRRSQANIIEATVCRFLDKGVSDSNVLASVMQLDVNMIEDILTDIRLSGMIVDDSGHPLLTMNGRSLLDRNEIDHAYEANVEVLFDAFSGSILDESIHSLVRGKKADGMFSIRPLVGEVDPYDECLLNAVQKILQQEQGTEIRLLDLSVAGKTEFSYHPLLLLCYRGITGPKHSAAWRFAVYDSCAMNGPDVSTTRLFSEYVAAGKILLDSEIIGDWLTDLVPFNETMERTNQWLTDECLSGRDKGRVSSPIILASSKSVKTEDDKFATLVFTPGMVNITDTENYQNLLKDTVIRSETDQKMPITIISDREKESATSADLKKPKYIMNKEVRDLFNRVFTDSQERICIICPFMSRRVINEEFKRKVEKALDRGVRIKIKYGMTPNNDPERTRREWESDEIAKALRKRGKGKTGKIAVVRANTHEKVLLCDTKYAIVGSFNFLSYAGTTPGPGFRDEGSLYVESPELVTEILMARFSDS